MHPQIRVSTTHDHETASQILAGQEKEGIHQTLVEHCAENMEEIDGQEIDQYLDLLMHAYNSDEQKGFYFWFEKPKPMGWGQIIA